MALLSPQRPGWASIWVAASGIFLLAGLASLDAALAALAAPAGREAIDAGGLRWMGGWVLIVIGGTGATVAFQRLLDPGSHAPSAPMRPLTPAPRVSLAIRRPGRPAPARWQPPRVGLHNDALFIPDNQER